MDVFKYGLRDDVEPLSKGEQRWLAKLEAHMALCPSPRIHLVTIGDSSLTVIDGKEIGYED